MIRAALDSNDQYYKHNPDPNPRVDYKAVEEVGRTLGSAQADRYVKTQVPQDISQKTQVRGTCALVITWAV